MKLLTLNVLVSTLQSLRENIEQSQFLSLLKSKLPQTIISKLEGQKNKDEQGLSRPLERDSRNI